jgi:hypothetical protein
MKKILTTLILLSLTGCIRVPIGSPKADQKTTDTIKLEGPVIYKQDPAEKELEKAHREKVTRDVKDQIISSTNSTKNQLSGLLTTSISKLGEKVTGVEANLSELLKIENELSIQAKAELKATIKAVADLKLELQNTMTLNSNIKANVDSLVKMINTLTLKIGQIDTTLQAQAQGQVGWNNKIESKMEKWQETVSGNTVSGDMNMFPKQAVEVLESTWKTFSIILGGIIGLAGFVLSLHFKFQKDKANKQFEATEKQRERTYELLHRALMHVPPEEAHKIERDMNHG